jgi:hypothetical protein
MTRTRTLLAIVALALVAATAAACGTGAAAQPSVPASPQVDAAAATAIAEQALDAFNTGDYANWSAHWDESMTSAIDEAAFLAAREELMATTGRYVAHDAPTLSSHVPGTYRWTFPVTFERQAATFWISFRVDSPLVVGVRFE